MQIRISGENIRRLLTEDARPILEIKIGYPQIMGNLSRECEYSFNNHYRTQARAVNRRLQSKEYAAAKKDFTSAIEDELDFTLHSFIQNFTVTRLEERFVSLYTDTYRYSGGLHGITHRRGNTWDLKRGIRVPLSHFFQPGAPYRAIALKYVTKKIKTQTNNFERAEIFAKQRFSENNFYLSGNSIVIYYPTYSIAPFAEGIRAFEIPFSEFQDCWRPNRTPDQIKKYVGPFAQADEENFL